MTIDPTDKDLKQQGLEIALEELNRQFGKGTVMSIDGNDLGPWPAISTGVMSLDMAVGIGGLPQGRIVEIYGPEGSGKSTLCCQIISEAQKLGGTAVYIDVEHALDPVYAAYLGVDLSPNKFVFSQPSSAEEALQIVFQLAKVEAVSVIVLDSVASLTPKDELEAGMEKWQVGLLPRLMGKGMRMIGKTAAESNTLIVFVNQIRYKVGMDAQFGNPETTPGGMALNFEASVRIRLQAKGKPLVDANGEIMGTKVEAKVIKNRMADPLKKVEFDLIFGEGFDNVGCILDVALSKGLLISSGAWIKYPDKSTFAQGRANAIIKLHEDPALLEKFKNEILNAGL